MRIALIGYGRMGHAVEEVIAARDDLVVAGIVEPGHLSSLREVEGADAAIDFSYPGDLADVLDSALQRRIPLVIGRTGMDSAQLAAIEAAAAHIPILRADNFSLGVTVLRRATQLVAQALSGSFDVEIVEAHHRMKLDAPSGTAKLLLSAVDPDGQRPVVHGREGKHDARGQEIGMHALRGGTVAGVHSVHFFGDLEEVTLSHRAESRSVFAIGAVRAAVYIADRAAGLYTMDDVLFGQKEDAR